MLELLSCIFGKRWIGVGTQIFAKSLRWEVKKLSKEYDHLFENFFIFKTHMAKKKVYDFSKESVFIQNVFPVDVMIDNFTLNDIEKLYLKLRSKLKKTSFKIETRNFRTEIKSRDIEVKLGTIIEGFNNIYSQDNPEQVIFILLHESKLYAGIVNKDEYLYPYLDLGKRISRQTGIVNHSQFKLIETVERYNLDFKEKKVLDLGAAPGGWSKYALDNGCSVVAIDPAKMEITHKKLIHLKNRVEKVKFDKEVFDYILCDMNLAAEESLNLLNIALISLKHGGKIVFTCKVSDLIVERAINKVKENLPAGLKIDHIKNLISNRQEVTFVFSKE